MDFANYIIKSAAIFDGTGKSPFKGAIAVKGNKIIKVGSESEIEELINEKTKILDYGDRLVMPGFNDGHAHMSYGSFLEDPDFCCHLNHTESLEDCMNQVKEFADSHPDNEWVFCSHLNHLPWKNPVFPNKKDIDKVIPDRPVVIQQGDFHTIAANTCAMEKCGITDETPNPHGGVIERDAEGKATGVFFDDATFAFTEPIYSPDNEVYCKVYKRFFDKLKSFGITSISDLFPQGVGCEDVYEIYGKMDTEGTKKTRIFFYEKLNNFDKEKVYKRRNMYNGDKLCFCGMKQILDGVCSVHTAYMLEPYTNKPESRGTTAVELGSLKEDVMKAYSAGIPVRLHTIGDAAVRAGLDIFEAAEEKYGAKDIRNVLEHTENIHSDDLSRFVELNVSACVQPVHMLLDMENDDKMKAIGFERCKLAWPLRSMLNNGTVLSMGTDFPIVEIDPLHEIYGAVTRKMYNGMPEEGWFPEQRITLEEALKAYTYGSAYAEGKEDIIGTIEEGKLADIIAIDRNLFKEDAASLLKAKVVMTMYDGEIVYEEVV